MLLPTNDNIILSVTCVYLSVTGFLSFIFSFETLAKYVAIKTEVL